MRIGILGAGNIGGTLGRKLAAAGHDVLIGVRDQHSPKAQAIHAAGLRVGTLAEAAAHGEIVVVALPLQAAQQALPALHLTDKIIVDTTNAFEGLPAGYPSAGAAVKAWSGAPGVVKTWNATPWEAIADPVYGGVAVETFICGDDAQVKHTVAELVRQTGFVVVDLGGLDNAPLTESFAKLWGAVAYGAQAGRGFAFKMQART